jgi:hypothetical protein
MILLKDATAPVEEVALLGGKAVQVYMVLWRSAKMDCRMDPRKDLPWERRRDCGGLAEWSKKGLAEHLGFSRTTVAKVIDQLLDNGFITVAGSRRSSNGKPYAIFRVIHPDMLEAQRYAISMFDKPPSERFKNFGVGSGDTAQRWSDDIDGEDSWTDSE